MARLLCRSAAALLFVLPVAAVVQAQGFEYAPGSARYRVVSTTRGMQEAMGQQQEFETSNNELLSVTVSRPSPDTLALSIRVDSVTAVGPLGMPVPGLDQLPGRTIVAKLSPYGAVYSATGPQDDSIPNGTQITNELSRILPRIRATLAAGATWVDTAATTAKQNGVDIARTVIATYTVAGDTTVGSEPAWKLTRTTATTMSGNGTAQGQLMSMEGTSTGSGVVLVSRKGTYLGSQSDDSSNVKITLIAQAVDVTVKTTSTTRVERVQ